MDTEFRTLIAGGDLDLLGAFFEEHRDYGEQFDLIIDSEIIGLNSVDIVNLLLSNGAVLGDNLLEKAFGNQAMVEVLLASGADVNKTNRQV